MSFNTQPPEGGWAFGLVKRGAALGFNTQPPEGGWHNAAGSSVHHDSFNTQPPEGGWKLLRRAWTRRVCFNTQPPEGGWAGNFWAYCIGQVSTHSRPKAAGRVITSFVAASCVFQHTAARRRLGRPEKRLHTAAGFNTQPPEGGWERGRTLLLGKGKVSTHSRPKAAGTVKSSKVCNHDCFNTQPPEGGWSLSQKPCSIRFRSPDFAKLLRKA